MNSTIYISGSGIKTHQFGVDSLSNNVANINTNGYRANVAEFKSIFSTALTTINASSPISNDFGYGGTKAANAISLKEGSLVDSDASPFNVALSGDGWFVVGENQEGQFTVDDSTISSTARTYFTRDGSFSLDEDAYLVNNSGYYLYGIDLGKIQDDGTFQLSLDDQADMAALGGTELTPLKIPSEISAVPTLTTEVDIALNLSRESNLKGVTSAYVDADGAFDETAFRAVDFSALFNEDEERIDFTKDDTLSITVTDSATAATTTYDFTYGTDFNTVGEFVDAVEAATGLSVNINASNTCTLSFSYEGTSDYLTVSATSDGVLASLMGLEVTDTKIYANSDAVNIYSKALMVPTYKTSIPIYDDQGTKFLMISDYVLTNYGDSNNDTWNVRTKIYDSTLTYEISDSASTGVISFASDGTPTYTDDTTGGDTSSVDFGNYTVTYNPANTATQTTTNRLYSDSGVVDTDVDGNPPGKLTEVTINSEGVIILHFSNNMSEPMGRIGMASFVNDQGLQKVGSNMFQMIQHMGLDGESKYISGAPQLMWSTDTGKLKDAKVLQYYLETSNVDITTALTDLIVMQRGYSANSKCFTTGDELLKEAINLKK